MLLRRSLSRLRQSPRASPSLSPALRLRCVPNGRRRTSPTMQEQRRPLNPSRARSSIGPSLFWTRMRPAAPNPHQTVSHRPKPHHLKLLSPKRRRLGCMILRRLHLILYASTAARGRQILNAYAATCLCVVGPRADGRFAQSVEGTQSAAIGHAVAKEVAPQVEKLLKAACLPETEAGDHDTSADEMEQEAEMDQS